MKKKKRRWWILGSIVISLAVFCLSPLFPFVRSLAVMRVYSALQERDSLEAETGLWIRMPGGTATPEKDWYPFVMTFNADGSFSRYCGRPSRLTILYNFGAFDYAKGASNLFNEASPYYNSFYGAYMVRQEGRSFGFEAGGEPSAEEIQLAPRFDFFRLVLADFGLKEADDHNRSDSGGNGRPGRVDPDRCAAARQRRESCAGRICNLIPSIRESRMGMQDPLCTGRHAGPRVCPLFPRGGRQRVPVRPDNG